MATTIYKTYGVELKDIEDSSRSFWALASTEAPDRDGDVISTQGWQLENYRKNPVILFAHKYDSPPIAKALEVGVSQGRLMFRAQFASRKEYPFADTIYKLYRGGYLRSFSVGFIPRLWEDIRGLKGRLFKEQELVEISAVPIPTNPQALIEAQKKGLITRRDIKSLGEASQLFPTEDGGQTNKANLHREVLGKLDLMVREAELLRARSLLSPEEVAAIMESALGESGLK
jgi:HK97 family phage prohead protease